MGDVPLDGEFARTMDLPFDRMAHAREHSAEVIIPFLQYFQPDHPFTIVPVCMGDQGHTFACLIAEKIRHAELATRKNIMVLASCDFSHFLAPEDGFDQDQHVIDEILSRDSLGVEEKVKKHHISICGYGPIMALMNYAGMVDPEYRIRILARGHSGEVIPSHEVVDYVSMIMYQ
jgi:AmmeMemoRadiSam system protein B